MRVYTRCAIAVSALAITVGSIAGCSSASAPSKAAAPPASTAPAAPAPLTATAPPTYAIGEAFTDGSAPEFNATTWAVTVTGTQRGLEAPPTPAAGKEFFAVSFYVVNTGHVPGAWAASDATLQIGPDSFAASDSTAADSLDQAATPRSAVFETQPGDAGPVYQVWEVPIGSTPASVTVLLGYGDGRTIVVPLH